MGLIELENSLIEGCLKNDRKAQNFLYKKYAPEMINVCMRYCRNRSIAEEAMQEAFLKVFIKIGQLKDPNKLRAWIKQIMVNSSLMKLRKKEKLVFLGDELLEEIHTDDIYIDNSYHYTESDLKQILSDMPKGYKVIFNMYVHDDYSHKEIAKMLNISESTSKSQLSRARNYLKLKLLNIKHEYYSMDNMGLLGSIACVYNTVF